MKKVIVFIAMLAVSSLFEIPCLAAIIRVPADQLTIQDGINAASGGDTVLIADGTYTGTANKNLDPLGKAITIQSENNNPATCVIDCQGFGRSFYIHSGEIHELKIIALTMTNGNVNDYGAGIYCSHSSPEIRNCVFSNNSANDGGGVYCNGIASPVFVHCYFNNNSAIGNNDDARGGGFQCINNSNPQLIDCFFYSNNATGNNFSAFGGAIDSFQSSPIITACNFEYNSVSSYRNSSFGGAVYLYEPGDSSISFSTFSHNTSSANGTYGQSGALQVKGVNNLSVSHCVFNQNSAFGQTLSFGGAVVWLVDVSLSPIQIQLSDCVFNGNSVTGNYAGGGGLFTQRCNGTITNCVFTGNNAQTQGGAIRCLSDNTISFENCTLSGNSSPSGGGIFVGYNTNSPIVKMNNSILWGNSPNETSVGSGSSLKITYSDIQGGYWGIGNICADPIFVAGGNSCNYRLSPFSPCVDAGCADGAPREDLDGNSRPYGKAVDMGAYEFHWPTNTHAYVGMPSHRFSPGDSASCSVCVWNVGNDTPDNTKLFVVLDVFGHHYFAPGFNSFDYISGIFQNGRSDVTVIPEFIWPSNAGSESGITWYAALTNPEMTELISEIGVFDFEWIE